MLAVFFGLLIVAVPAAITNFFGTLFSAWLQLAVKEKHQGWGRRHTESSPSCQYTLCSRIFQNVKLRQHGVEILQFACHSDFKWNQILVDSNGHKMFFLVFLEVLKLDFSTFKPFLRSWIYQNWKLWVSEIAKWQFLSFKFYQNLVNAKLNGK